MQQTIRTWLIGAAAALACSLAGASGEPVPMDEQAYEAARDRIEAQAKAQAKACRRQRGNAAKVCEAQARGTEKTALAALEAQRDPTPELEQKAKEVKADAERAVARQRCAELEGSAKDRCRRQADAAHEAAIRRAKVEKVERLAQLQAASREGRQGKAAAEPTEKERLAAEKARCWMLGAERERCLADVQRRYGKS